MAEEREDPGWWTGEPYRENRQKHSIAYLRQFTGEWIAWNMEGTEVVAHHVDCNEVDRQFREMGLGTSRVVMEWMPPADYPDVIF